MSSIVTSRPQLKIGPATVDFPYVLAPMASITNAPFRLIMKELGAGVVVSELVSATGIKFGGQKTLDLCKYFEGERPVGLQIFGEDFEDLANAAAWLERTGVDFVDINMGCPVPKVVKKGGGAALCRDPKNLFDLVRHVKSAIKIPLTIKIRTGWDAGSINTLENVCAAAEGGAAWVAIHGRTRAQGYEGDADWELMAQVKAKSPIPIIGNGDILTARNAVDRLKQSGCDAVMIGRGALRNPFLFLEILEAEGRALTADQKAYRTEAGTWDYSRLIRRQWQLLQENYQPVHAGIQLRKFLNWYSAGFDGASVFRKALFSIPTDDAAGNEEVFKLGQQFFGRAGFAKQASYLADSFLKGGHG